MKIRYCRKFQQFGKSCDRATNSNLLSYRNFQQLWIITIELAGSTKGENPLLSEIPAIVDHHDSPSNSNLLSYRNFQQLWIITIVRWLNNFAENQLLLEIPAIW
ncbi:MAG: hypothetical protein F6K26_32155, partial [Moorea sp. SIO2I5]|nr:hypothetical protein [Moorena sp. SIO2I5]